MGSLYDRFILPRLLACGCSSSPVMRQRAKVIPHATGQVLELHRAGKLRIIAVTSAKRLASAPDVPTAVEAGLPGMIVTGSIGLLAPAGTPRPVVDQISQATAVALADPAFQNILKEAAMEPVAPAGPDHWKRVLADDISLWEPVVKKIGLKID